MKFSCNGCGNRAPGCHAKCETYAREKAAHEAQRAKDLQRRIVDSGLRDQRATAISKATRKKRKGNSHGEE